MKHQKNIDFCLYPRPVYTFQYNFTPIFYTFQYKMMLKNYTFQIKQPNYFEKIIFFVAK